MANGCVVVSEPSEGCAPLSPDVTSSRLPRSDGRRDRRVARRRCPPRSDRRRARATVLGELALAASLSPLLDRIEARSSSRRGARRVRIGRQRCVAPRPQPGPPHRSASVRSVRTSRCWNRPSGWPWRRTGRCSGSMRLPAVAARHPSARPSSRDAVFAGAVPEVSVVVVVVQLRRGRHRDACEHRRQRGRRPTS